MTFTLKVREEAEEDLLQACEWYDSRKAGLGDRLLDQVEILFERIRVHPEQWPEEFHGIRRARIPGFPYITYFLVENPIVEVIAVTHGRRHPRSWQSRL
jgi:toxin ParE1/3/4